MSERDDTEDVTKTLKALPVFRTLRTNLALFSAFARQSALEPAIYSGEDLEFLGVEPGQDQLMVHNGAVHTILVALLAQALNNYFELKRINPRLEDPDLETLLDGLGERDKFVSGMTKTRNAVFHVKSRRAWRDRDVVSLRNRFQQRDEAGDTDALGRISFLLYDFTQKCFLGDLKFWPLGAYKELEALAPELRKRMDAGDASLDEVIEALGENSDPE